jgi:hypothetical protein
VRAGGQEGGRHRQEREIAECGRGGEMRGLGGAGGREERTETETARREKEETARREKDGRT